MTLRPIGWCILTTSPGRTLPLAEALCEAGITAWTPSEVITKHVGRKRKRVERRNALVPSIVFADFGQLGRLLEMSRSPAQTFLRWDAEERRMVSHGMPPFSVFHAVGGFCPMIRDKALDPLREVERALRPTVKASKLAIGSDVSYPEGGFEGLAGTVTGHAGKYALVQFHGFPIAIKIEARHLVTALAA